MQDGKKRVLIGLVTILLIATLTMSVQARELQMMDMQTSMTMVSDTSDNTMKKTTTDVPKTSGTPQSDQVSNPCQDMLIGDMNKDEIINILDLIFLVEYLHNDGMKPEPMCLGDIDEDGDVDMADIGELSAYLFGEVQNQGIVIPGDANADGDIDIADVTYLVAYLFGGGPEPDPVGGDVNGDGMINVVDVTMLTGILFPPQ